MRIRSSFLGAFFKPSPTRPHSVKILWRRTNPTAVFIPVHNSVRIVVSAFLALFFLCEFARADNYYVNASTGSNTAGSGTQAAPWKTITYALGQISGSGHTLNVSAGTYNAALGETFPIMMKNGVSIIGESAQTTIVDAKGSNGVVKAVGISDPATVVKGFTIQGGGNTNQGGGLFITAGSAFKLQGCRITSNIVSTATAAKRYGGGIYILNSSPTIVNCEISGNTVMATRAPTDPSDFGAYGAGVAIVGTSSPQLLQNIIRDNEAQNSFFALAYGAGVYVAGSATPLLESNTISSNTLRRLYATSGTTLGAGISIENSGGVFTGNTIASNGIKADYGSLTTSSGIYIAGSSSKPKILRNVVVNNTDHGIWCELSATPTIVNNTIVENTGDGIYLLGATPDSIVNNIVALNSNYGINESSTSSDPGKVWYNLFYANSAGLYRDEASTEYYSASTLNGGVSECKNNLEGDPLFVDRANGDYRLRSGSPAINAGDLGTPLDPDGTRADIGALYYVPIATVPSAPPLSSPSNTATSQPTTLTLTWGTSTGATKYHLQVSITSAFTTLVVDDSSLTGASRSVSPLANGTMYYWRARAGSSAGWSAFSSSWSFTTVFVPPSAPILASPLNGSTGLSTSPNLSWNASTGATSYQLQVSANSNFSPLVVNQSGITGTSYSASGLANNTVYYWHINATNAGGSSSYCSTWSFTTMAAAAQDYYVNASTGSNTSGNGTQSSPWKTITYALGQITGSGRTLYVSAGTYNTALGESFPIMMNDGVSLVGAGIDMSIIDAGGTNTVIRCVGIVIVTTRLEGFTIKGGGGVSNGGGIFVSAGSVLRISGNKITGNSVSSYGGGIYVMQGSLPAIENNTITSNYAFYDGSAIYVLNASPSIEGNTLTGNECDSPYNGSAVYLNNSSPVLDGNVVSNNRNKTYSAHDAIIVYGSSCAPTIVNNVIAKNEGSGILCASSGQTPTIINNTISDNTGDGIGITSATPDSILNNIISLNSGYGIREGSSTSDPGKVWYNLFYANGSGVYRDEGTTDYYTSATMNTAVAECKNNLDGDPLFVDRVNGDYHLRLGSPAIDRGDPASAYNNEPLPNGGRINIGAYGNTSEATTSTPSGLPNSADYYVNASTGSNSAGNGTQSTPWKTITYALGQISGSGHTLYVSAGTYNTTLGETFPTMMNNGVSLVGAGMDVSIIDAGATNTVIRCAGIVDASTRVEGFTIKGGGGSSNGGGFYVSAGSALKITGNKITGNSVSSYGGGIYVASSSPTIENNTITSNYAFDDGSATYLLNASPSIKGNTMSGNRCDSPYNGSAVYLNNSSPRIEGNVVLDNRNKTYSVHDAIIVYGSSSAPTIVKNVVAKNVGSGILCASSGQTPTIINNTISDNTGDGIEITSATPDSILNNIISLNSGYGIREGSSTSDPGKVWYNLSYANGSGVYRDEGTTDYYTSATMNTAVAECKNNLDGDPLFVDRANGDYRLRSGSPAINAGDPGSPADPDGSRTDIGAFYYQPTAPSVPALTSPLNGASAQPTTVTLTWATSAGAIKYHLQVSTLSAFTTLVVDDSSLTGASRSVGPLANGTMHYWRARAGNSGGWSAFSGSWSFTTISILPIVSTGAPTNVAATSATLNGTINPNGAPTTTWFEWGTSSTLSLPTSTTSQSIGSGASAMTVSASLSALTPSMTYYYRAVAQNEAGTQRGSIISFTTAASAPAWAVQSSGVSVTLYSVRAVNGNVAWACGAKGTILRTMDGGTTWTQTSPLVSSLNCYSIEADDATTAWVVAHDPNSIVSVLYKTTNGGSTWTQQLTSSDPTTFYDAVRFYDANSGILLGDPEGGYFVIYTTTDGGYSWSRTAAVNIPAPAAGEHSLANNLSIAGNDAWFSTVNNSGGNPRVFRSIDRGKTWQVSPGISGLGNGLSTTAFAGETVGLVQGINGSIIRTTDGGVTWGSTIITGATVGGTIDFATPTAAVFLGPGGQSGLSLDAGLTWSARSTPDTTTMCQVSFSSSTDGWAAGNRGTIWKWVGGVLPGPPWVTTSATTDIGPTSATVHAIVTPNANAANAQFEWGTTTAVSNTTAVQALGAGSNPLPISATLSDLTPNTTYFVRATAQNSSGTTKGSMTSFTTVPLAGDPNEPNNTSADATPIAYNFKSSGAEIGPAGDVDYYKFSATTGDFVSIEVVTDPNGSLDVRVSLYDPAGNEVAYSDIVSTGTERVLFGIDKTQTYYVRVADASDGGSFPNAVGPTNLGKGQSPAKVGASSQMKRSILQTGSYTLTLATGAPLPPQGLTAGTGFDGIVPLRWIRRQSNAPSEYRIYRSTSSTGPFNLVGATYLEDFVDLTAANGVPYFYEVKSVYAATNAESPPSNIVKATPRANGYNLTSPFAFIRPTLDGKIRSGEWVDAQVQDVTVKRTLTSTSSVTMYLKNDDKTLYIAVEDSNANQSTYNFLVIGFDRDLNKTWDQSSPSNEGFITINDSAGVPIVLFYGVTQDYPSVGIADGIRDPNGVTAKFSYEPKSLHYEVALDLTRAAPAASGMDAIGLYVGIVSNDSLNGESPPGALLYAPITFAEVTLSKATVARLPGEYTSDASTILLLHMNESIGPLAIDATGNGNNGVASGTTILDGRFGKARNFNGTGDYIAGSSSALNFGAQDFTIEGWINTSSSASQAVFAANSSLTATASNIGLYVAGGAAGGFIDLDINNSQGTSGSNLSGRKVNDGRWHHVAGVRSSGKVYLYVDGALDGQKSVTQNPNNSNAFLVGSNSAGALFKGLVDELRISNKARTPNEFNLQLPPKNLTASASGQTINLSWQNGGGGVALMRYKIYRGLDSTNVVLIDSTISTAYSNAGLAGSTKFFYRVAAVDSTGFESARTAAVTATTGSIAVPSLVSPVDSAANQPTTVTLSWTGSAGAIDYRLQVDTTKTFALPVYSDSTIVGTSAQVKSLLNGTKYYWRVSVKTAAGRSGYSAVWSFTTIVAAPGVPTLTTPANGATNVSIAPTLTWNAVTGATYYHLQISASATFTSTVLDKDSITAPTFAVTGLLNATPYYWRVLSWNVGGTSTYASPFGFTTIVAAPGAPTLATPSNGATNVSITPTMTWNAVTGATYYHLQISTSASFTSTVLDKDSITAPTFGVAGLLNATPYYWRVLAWNVGGTSLYSTAWSFTTIVAAPGVPALVTPSKGATNVATSLTLVWNAASGASTYRLQVATDSNFASIVLNDSTLTATQRAVGSLTNSVKYYWRVNATSVGGTSQYSMMWNFTTIVAAPSQPTLANPTNGATNQPIPLTLSWNSVAGAISYRLQVDTSNTFPSPVVDDSLITTSRAVSSPVYGTRYYWRVNATNAGGTSGWSPVWSFTTIGVAPVPVTTSATSVAATTATLNGSVNPNGSATDGWFDWGTNSTLASSSATSNKAIGAGTNTVAVTADLTSLSSNTQYYYRVGARNSAGTQTGLIVGFVTTPGATVLSTPASGASGQPISPTLTWNSIAGVTYNLQVSLNAACTAPFALEDSSATASSRSLSNLAANTTYYWRVRAKGLGGYGAWSSIFSFVTLEAKPVTSPGVSFPSNPSASTDYRLVSFPGTSSLNVGQVLSGAQNTDWRIFRDNGAAEPNNLAELPSSSSLSPGEGYWLVTKGTFNFSNTVTMPQLSSDGSYTMNVRNGWNIIGNPFDVSVSWTVVKADNSSTATLWSYAGTGGYQAGTTLEPFKGYYFNSSSTTLKIRYPFPSMSVAPVPSPAIDWKLQIALETEGNNDAENYIGMAPKAKEFLDELDQRKPPRFLDQAFLSFSLSAPDGEEQYLSSDFRPSAGEGQVWNFSVSNPKRAQGKIRIIGIESVPPGFEVVLIDAQNTVPIDLRAKNDVSFRNSSERQVFHLMVGKKDFVQAKEAQLVPKEFELSQNYPNPFNPSTTITYKVPREATVRLEIVSLLGQQLETLAQGIHTPGTYSVAWSSVERHSSSGVYFARLLVDGQVVKTQKMTLLK